MSGKKARNEVVIGAVVIVILAVVYFGVSFLKGVNIFSTQTRYYAIYDEIGGLDVSSPVIINGFKIGIVKSIELESNGSGRLVVEVVLNNADVAVPKDSQLKIYDSDFFGGKAIQIVMGDSSVMANSRDTLIATVEKGLAETLKNEIDPIKQKSTQIFQSVDSVLATLQRTLNNSGAEGLPSLFSSLQRTMNNLEATSANLNVLIANNGGRVSEIISNAQSLTNTLKANNDRIDQAIKNITQFTDTLSRIRLTTTLYKVDQAMGHFESVMTKVNSGQGTLGKLVNNDSLHNELVNATHSLDLLLDDMRNHPKNYVGFSMFGRRDTEKFSKTELEDMRKIIDQMIQEKGGK
jgi:phospholipid/cholesterol/gamma-HCH transport system substrate-binding protein